MRAEGLSVQRAARDYGIDPRTVIRLAGSALRKAANGRYAAKPTDRLLRPLVIPTREGLREIVVRGSHQASQIAGYSNAVQKYVATGDDTALRKFVGKHIIDASGSRIPLLTSLAELDRLASAGVLSFESLYAELVECARNYRSAILSGRTSARPRLRGALAKASNALVAKSDPERSSRALTQ
jgi:hypothetical protein